MNENHLCAVIFTIGFVTGLIVTALFLEEAVSRRESDRVHKAAIEAGAGEYYLDEKHEKQFRFIPGNNQRNNHEAKP